jgi:5-methylcytosine-specific restriction endonuclease McrA
MAPWAPAKRCLKCGARFVGRKCPACVQRYEQARRGDPLHELYKTPAWRALRAAFLRDHPTCVDCGRPATEADHLLPVRERPDLALALENLAPRCKADHARRTSRLHSWNRR